MPTCTPAISSCCPTTPRIPATRAVDFGIVGTLDPRDQEYLAQNFLAVFDRDYRRVATLHVDSGWVPHDISVSEMENAVRTICEPIFDKPLKDISFATVLLQAVRGTATVRRAASSRS